MIFLQEMDLIGNQGFATALLAAGIAIILLFVIFILAMYILMSLAFMKIAQKAKYKSPGIAWIPLVGPGIIASKIAKMHWWPLLLLIGIIIPWISGIAGIAYLVFFIIWNWKMYEAIKRPGWWSIFWIISPVGLILALIAAYGKN